MPLVEDIECCDDILEGEEREFAVATPDDFNHDKVVFATAALYECDGCETQYMDKEDGCRWERGFDEEYWRCTESGADIMAVTRTVSIHELPNSGFGNVKRGVEPYCPVHEEEPKPYA